MTAYEPPMTHDVLSAAAALRVCRTTIYGLIKAGRLKTVKAGRRTLITRESLEAFAKGGDAL